jgi:hypothetical protein
VRSVVRCGAGVCVCVCVCAGMGRKGWMRVDGGWRKGVGVGWVVSAPDTGSSGERAGLGRTVRENA